MWLSRDIKTTINVWGCSSIGRAPALQAGGRRFDPDWLHQSPSLFRKAVGLS